MITFDARRVLATPSSTATMHMRVDDGETHKADAVFFSNSYNSGYITASNTESRKILAEMLEGKELFIRVDAGGDSQDGAVSLGDFKTKTASMVSDCNNNFRTI